MGFISHDYYCPQCDASFTELRDRSENLETTECLECGTTATKQLNINITRVSYVDGTDRWKYVKERRTMQKAMREAKKQGRTVDVTKMKEEIETINRHSRKDKKAETPCKVSTPEK